MAKVTTWLEFLKHLKGKWWSLVGNGNTDPNMNFLGTTDNKPLVIKTNAAEAMRIGRDGKVGVGTPNPSDELHVRETVRATIARFEGNGQGSVVFFDGAATDRGRMGFGTAGHIFSEALPNSFAIRSEAALHLGISSSVVMTIREIGYPPGNGYIGIGTSEPTALLTVAGEDSPRIHITSNSPGPNPSRTWGLISFTDGNFCITDVTASVDRLVITKEGDTRVTGSLEVKGPRPWADVRALGAVGDGQSHPLGSYYTTLQQAQAVYPHATSLDQEIDWAAIQAAVDSLVNGGTVLFPAGVYRITSSITVANPSVTLRGCAGASTVRAASASFHLFRCVADSPYFHGLVLEGGASDDATTQFAIFTDSAQPAKRGRVAECCFGGPSAAVGANNGIKLDTGSDGWTIERNLFERLIGHNGTIGNGYGILLGTSHEHRIWGNRFLGDQASTPGQGRHAVYLSAGASRSIVTGNYVDKFNSSSIAVFSKPHQPPCSHNRIAGNVINDQAEGETGTAGVELTGQVENTVVEANTILRSGRHGVILEDAGTSGGNIGNRISGNLILQAGQFGVLIRGAKRAEVAANAIIDCSQSSVGVYAAITVSLGSAGEVADGNLILNNTLTSTDAPTHRCGVTLDKTCPVPTNTMILGNRIRPGLVVGDIELNGVAVSNTESLTVPGNFQL